MPILRINQKKDNFVMLDKGYINNPEFSLSEKGLLTLILAMPDNWDINITDLVKRSKDGRDAHYNALNNLISKGYITRKKVPYKNGSVYRYNVYESLTLRKDHISRSAKPDPVSQDLLCKDNTVNPEKPTTPSGNPDPGNPDLLVKRRTVNPGSQDLLCKSNTVNPEKPTTSSGNPDPGNPDLLVKRRTVNPGSQDLLCKSNTVNPEKPTTSSGNPDPENPTVINNNINNKLTREAAVNNLGVIYLQRKTLLLKILQIYKTWKLELHSQSNNNSPSSI